MQVIFFLQIFFIQSSLDRFDRVSSTILHELGLLDVSNEAKISVLVCTVGQDLLKVSSRNQRKMRSHLRITGPVGLFKLCWSYL